VLARLLPVASRPLTLAFVTCTVLGALLPIVFALVSGVAVDAVPAALDAGLGSPGGRRLVLAAGLLGALFTVQQTLGLVSGTVAYALARRVRRVTFRRAMVAILQPPTIAHLEDPALLDRIADATTLGPIGPGGGVTRLANQWRRWLVGVGGLVLLARFRWWLAVLLAGAELLNLGKATTVYSELIAFRTAHLPELRRAVYLRGLALEPHAAKETRLFGLAGWVVERFRGAWLEPMTEIWRRRRGFLATMVLAALPVAGVVLVAFVLLGRAAAQGEVALGAVVIYGQAIMTALQLGYPGETIYIRQAARMVRATEELEEVAGTDPLLQMSGTQPAGDRPQRDIRMENVAFRYPGSSVDVLRGVDLTIPAGRSLAIVGDNGAGKTTLVKVLARLYETTGGRITVDGDDLRDLDAASWQQRVTTVFQDFVRWPLSAADNVGLDAPEEDLVEAAARAGARGLVESLPSRWQTPLTREFAGGVELSGGEWQRIALTRALCAARRRGGGLLVLDEPTAHLDVRAEADFYNRFLDVTRGCTTIVISHRFSTVRRADQIVVLDGGRVVERGSHDELIAAGGRYASMFLLQAARFGSGADGEGDGDG
jgi:ATP-binding cassette subfamily B protein